MPNSRLRKSSMSDLMAKMPVNKGSLLTSIENLLKTIESSESSVMIPTLLRDKCEFDAWELLFVAKILKASILGHTDLVEFYLNHIDHQKNLVAAAAITSTPSTPTTTSTPVTLRQLSSPALSPAAPTPINNHQNSTNGLNQIHHTITNGFNHNNDNNQTTNGNCAGASSSSSACSVSSITSSTSTATATGPSTNSSITWMSATSQLQQQQQQPQSNNHRSGSSSISSCSSQATSSISNGGSVESATISGEKGDSIELAILARTLSTPSMSTTISSIPSVSQSRPQPPSLLQLTTTNNYINSRANNNNLTSSGAIEQSTSSTLQLLSSPSATTNNQIVNQNGNTFELGSGALSISTMAANQQQQQRQQQHQQQQQQQQQSPVLTPTSPSNMVHHELRSSRSAGCLFRNNQSSGASSPRTPNMSSNPATPCQAQAETLANGGTQLVGDPNMPVKLLLQIEQLKSSIVYVTNLLENVVDLYKKSIDNIA